MSLVFSDLSLPIESVSPYGVYAICPAFVNKLTLMQNSHKRTKSSTDYEFLNEIEKILF